jgi:hypothetical protein
VVDTKSFHLARLRALRLRHEQAAAEAARHAAGSESLTELVAEARRKVAEARAARAVAAAAAEKLRKEQQRQRKVEEALRGAMAETKGSVEAVEEAMRAAAKHVGCSESLAALVAEAKGMVEQARAAEAEAAAERLRMEERLAALALRMQRDALEVRQMQAQLGVPPAAPAPQSDAEETLCVVCFDAPKQHAMVPCMHMCVCAACAQRLLQQRPARCPVCRAPIERTARVFT